MISQFSNFMHEMAVLSQATVLETRVNYLSFGTPTVARPWNACQQQLHRLRVSQCLM